MRRVFLEKQLFNKLFFFRLNINSSSTKNLNITKSMFISKQTIIINDFVGKRYFYHVGKKILSLKINFQMIGYKFGEFVVTRKKEKKKSKK